MERFEVRFVARGDETQLLTSHTDATFIGAVIDSVEIVDRPISHVVIAPPARNGGGSRATPEDLVVTAGLLDLPSGPARFDRSWERVLVHLCGTPDPQLVQEWIDRAADVVADKAVSRVAWFEVSDASDGDGHWGELHVTGARDQAAVDDLLGDPAWIAGQPTLDQLVGRRYQLVTRPLLNRLETILRSPHPQWPAPRRLAVYGSLAPGCPNHHVLADLRGRWLVGTVRGHLRGDGWGAEMGYPGLDLDGDGDEVTVHVLDSVDLAAHWDRLDEFEGPGYQRVRVAVSTDDGDIDAQLYILSS